jgi:azurin
LQFVLSELRISDILRSVMAMSRRTLLLGCAAVPLTVIGCGRKRAPEQRVVDLFIASDGDFLAYKPDTLTCPSGSIVRLTFHHGGKFLSARHNWVLVEPGQMEAVDKDVDDKEGIISKDDKRVIASTPMCDKGVTVMTRFTAPAPGDYPFFCSTPGHGECMNGVLHVI